MNKRTIRKTLMPNGIYVIVEEDLEAFLNGTLVFHPYGGETE